VTALQRSLDAIMRRHEILRTTFAATDDGPIQVIAPALALPLPVCDLCALLAAEHEVALQQLLAAEARRSFDLARGPLLWATLLRLGQGNHVLLLTLHHIVADGWSIRLLVQELLALYEAFKTGKPALLPELPIQYADFAVWQRAWLQGDVLEAQLAYWRQHLGGSLPVLELPTDHLRPPIQTFRGAREVVQLSRPLTAALTALSRREGVTLFMTLLTAFKVLLARYTGQDDILVGAPIAGRKWAETEHLLGFFLNTLVLRTDVSGNPTFRELLHRVREVCLSAYVHQDLPFEKLLEELQPQRDLSRTALFQVFFNMLNLPDVRIDLPELMAEFLAPPTIGSNFDLTLYVQEGNKGIQLDLVYNADLFESVRMLELLEQLRQLLAQFVANPTEPIGDVSLVTPTALACLLDPAELLDARYLYPTCAPCRSRAGTVGGCRPTGLLDLPRT
jgi:hypothetical protein